MFKNTIKDALQENTVIHCETESQAEILLSFFKKLGYLLNTDEAHQKYNYWFKYLDSTCYDLNNGMYSSLEFYQENNYKIIKFIDIEFPNFSNDKVPF